MPTAEPTVPAAPGQNRTPKKASRRWTAAFLASLRQQGNVSAAARVAGISRSVVHEARAADPGFAAAWTDAIEEGADTLEAEARRRAFAGSDTLLIFLLKAARPQKYRENVKHVHAGDIVRRVVLMPPKEPAE